MRKLLTVVVLLVVLVLVVWNLTARRPEPRQDPSFSTQTSHASETNPVTPLVAVEPQVPSSSRETTPSEAPKIEDAHAATVQAGAPKLAEIRGRLLLPGGIPAQGVQLSVHGWESNGEQVIKYGKPDHWSDPNGTSGADGRFSLRFDPPQAYQFVLDASMEGWCTASWRWYQIATASVVDVGDVELVLGGSVRGRIVDTKKRSLAKGWMVYADSAAPTGVRNQDGGRDETRVMKAPDEATGEFLLEGVPPGRVHLKAYSAIANWIDGPNVDVIAGEETKADIPYEGPDNEARIVVISSCRPFFVFSGEPAEVILSAPGFEPRKATKVAQSSQSFSFEDVPPGSYTVEIRDERFQPWSKIGVRPGQTVNARLKGSSAVSLQVVDGASGAPINKFALDVRFDHVNFRPNLVRVLEAKDDPPPGGLFDGLVPKDQTLIVHADGFAACEVPVPDLKSAETRVLVARLGHGRVVAGRVVTEAARTPLASAQVSLFPFSDGDHDAGFSGERDPNAKALDSDAAGRFSFEGVPPGSYKLRASRGKLFKVEQKLTVAADKAPGEFEIVLPAPAYLVGKLIGPDGASFEGLRILATPPVKKEESQDSWEDRGFFSNEEVAEPLAKDGTFRHGPIPAGDVEVRMCLPTIQIPSERGSMTTDGMTFDLGIVTLAPDADTHKEFDVRGAFPGSIRVRERVNGLPASSVVVRIEDAQRGTLAGALSLDAQGTGKSGFILPGTYRITSSPVDSSWIHLAPSLRTLKAGESIAMELDVQLLQGVLHVVDAESGRALANTGVYFTPELGGQTSQSAHTTTDDQGNARLALPPAAYQVEAGQFPGFTAPQSRVTIQWTSSGPVPAEVRVKLSEFPK